MLHSDLLPSASLIITAACVLGFGALSIAQEAPSLKLLADTCVSENAHNFPDGPFGTSLNGQTYQQEGVVSFNGYQYAAFFENPGVVCVGRRKLPDAKWEVIRFEDYQIKDHRDAHNVAVVGVSHDDGSIHLAYDHHCHPLHYRKSVPGIATDPAKADWSAKSFGVTTSELETGKKLDVVTYPMFFNRPDGVLQLAYRTGYSGNGDWHLAEYDGAKGTWAVLGMLFKKEGQYQTSKSRCAYPNPFRYGPGNRLHATWCWREKPTDGPYNLRTNHDILYAYSDDFGRTWKNGAGEQIARLGESTIGLDTPGILAAQTKFMHGQMNQNTQYIDSKGRVHAMSWHRPPEEAEPSVDLNTWRYYHYWRDEAGTWHEQQLPFVGRKPQIVLDDLGNAYVIHTRGENRNYHKTEAGGKLTISRASEAGGWTDWKDVYAADWTAVGEPLFDLARWKTEGVLSVYLQQKPTESAKPSTLHVIDFGR